MLLLEELVPAVIVQEDKEQEDACGYLCYSYDWQPFAKAYFHIVLDADAHQVIEHDKRAMDPAELIGD